MLVQQAANARQATVPIPSGLHTRNVNVVELGPPVFVYSRLAFALETWLL